MFHMQTVPGYLTAAGRLRVVDRFVDFDSLYRNQKQAHERVDSLSRAIRTSVSWFIREVSSPRNFIATVSPDKKGKSVEWTKARTHYVLINKAHPANRKDVATGAEVVTTDAHIKRQAHSRRAHARVLRSPRFRNKQGQIIHIAACWVGPQEWKEPGGIYRLVSPRTSRAV